MNIIIMPKKQTLATLIVGLATIAASAAEPAGSFDPTKPVIGSLDYKLEYEAISKERNLPHCDIRVGYATDGEKVYRGHTRGVRVAPLPIENLWTEGKYTDLKPKGMNTWPAGMFYNKANGSFYWFAHHEGRYFGGTHFRTFIQLYKTADKFKTVESLGQILRTAAPDTLGGTDFYGAYFPQGPGDMTMFADEPNGYLYCYYVDMKANRINQNAFWMDANQYSFRVARCAFDALDDPTAWKKWYRGSFSEPGLGGRESDLFSYPYRDLMYCGKQPLIVFSKPLDRYIAFFSGGFTTWCTDLDKQDWSPMYKLNIGLFGYPSCGSWYDPETNDQFRVGRRGIGLTTVGNLYDLQLTKTDPYSVEIIPDVYPPEEINEPERPYDPTAEAHDGYPRRLMIPNIAAMEGFSKTGVDETTGPYRGGNMRVYNPKNADAPGGAVSGTFELAEPGAYRVYASGYTNPAMGIWRLYLNGRQQGPDMDLYELPLKASGLAAKFDDGYRRHDQGYFELDAAPSVVSAKWEHRGKRAVSTGHAGQFDRLIFEAVNDNFNDTELKPQWTRGGKDAAGAALENGSLRLVGAAASETPSALLQTPRKGVFPWYEWDILTRIDFQPEKAGQEAGLIVQGAAGRFLAVGSALGPGGQAGYAVTLDVGGGKKAFFIESTSSARYLRISRRGDAYTCSWSESASDWTTGKTFEHPDLGTGFPQVGVYCSGPGATAEFDWFDLTRCGDVRVGNRLADPAPRKYQVEHIEGDRLTLAPQSKVRRTRDNRATGGYYDLVEFAGPDGFVAYTIPISSWNGIKGPCAQSESFQTPGRYRVTIGYVAGPDRGRVHLEVDGRPFAELDLSGEQIAFEEKDAGEIHFATDGPKTFRFAATAGPDGAAKNVAIDYIELVPVNPPLVFENTTAKTADTLSPSKGKPAALRFDVSALPPHAEIAGAVLKTRLARKLEPGSVLEIVPGSLTDASAAVRFAVAGDTREDIAVDLTRLVRAWVRGDLPAAAGASIRVAEGAGGGRGVVLANPRLEVRHAALLQAENASLANGAEVSTYTGARGPVVRDDTTVPDWAWEMLKHGSVLYGGRSVVLDAPGENVAFDATPGAEKIRIRYNAEKDTRLSLSVNGGAPVTVDIPSVGAKEINKTLNMAFFDHAIDIPRGGRLEIALAEGAEPITIDCVQFAGSPNKQEAHE